MRIIQTHQATGWKLTEHDSNMVCRPPDLQKVYSVVRGNVSFVCLDLLHAVTLLNEITKCVDFQCRP
jgi:hypothetical protein